MPNSLKDIEIKNDPLVSDSIFNLKILIVDDTEFSLCIIKEIFISSGFKNLILARDGQEAIEKTRLFKPDLVVLDILMPKVDGFQYCTIMRKDKDFSNLPILVQSATNSKEFISSSFSAGATDFINKPINPDELISRSVIHLENRVLLQELSIYKSRVADELEEAREMQKCILPSDVDIDKFKNEYSLDIASFFKPSSELGGDFWGVKELSDNKFSIYNVDFSGHGVKAAINTFRLHALMEEDDHLREQQYPNLYIERISKKLNNIITTGQYATVFYGVVDIENNSLEYVLTGAPSPIIVSSDGETRVLPGAGIPVGAIKDATYSSQKVSFNKGDALFTYSDALIETRNYDNNVYSEDKISENLKQNNSLSADEMLFRLLEDFNKYTAFGEKISDDITTVLIRHC